MSSVESFAAEPPPLRMNGDGVILVGETRVPLDTVVGEYEDGATPEEIVQSFSSLELADVYAVISYYLRHRSKIEAYVRRRREQADEVRRENEARFPRKEYESGCLLGVTVPHSPRYWRFSPTRTFTGGL